jgi:acyl-coenzyme A synthetase/AMP-(fatty) acid ligase
MTLNFSSVLLDSDPDRVLYIYQGQNYTTKIIQDNSWDKVNALTEIGVRPQQRVLLIANDSIDWISTFWALTIIGSCVIVLHPDTAIDQIKIICSKHSIDFIVTDKTLPDTGSPVLVIDKLTTLAKYQIVPYNYSVQEPFVCFSTSGTNGNAKLTMHTNQSLLAWRHIMSSFYERISFNRNETMFCLAKMSFVVGFMNNIVGTMCVGTRSLIGVRPVELRNFDKLCKKFSVNTVMLTPYFLELILNSKVKTLPDTVKNVVSGAEPLTDILAESFSKQFSQRLINCYGLSETCINLSESTSHKSKSIGQPLNTVKIKIINDNNTDCNVGEIGTMFIRTPGQTIGYLDDPAATSELLIDGWVNTRDLVSQDKDGDVIFHGRKNSCVKHKGQWVSLLDIEHTILELSGIENCVVMQTVLPSGAIELVALIKTINNCAIEKNVIQSALLEKNKKSFLNLNSFKFVEDIPTTVNTKKIRNYSAIKESIKLVGMQ